jgi:hypothetical protein
VPWSAAGYRQFVGHVDLFEGDATMQAAFRLSTCGLRRGQVLGLDWSHVDSERGTVHVEASRVTLAIQQTWASVWLAAGGSIPDGAAFLGHTVPIFLSTYVRTTGKSMEETFRQIAARMWAVPEAA